MNDEEDAEKRLIGALPTSMVATVIRELKEAARMSKERPEEGLKIVKGIISEAKWVGDNNILYSAQSQYIREVIRLERYEEAVAMATECLASLKKYCSDSSDTFWIAKRDDTLEMLAYTCGMTGRFDESKRAFDELIASATRVFGRDHDKTQNIFFSLRQVLREMATKAHDLVSRGDLANAAGYADAVLSESKARDFLDANDPNVQMNCETMVVAACVLSDVGREKESLAVSRLCLESARERKDLDSGMSQKCMWNYVRISHDLYGPTKDLKVVLDDLRAISPYKPEAPRTQSGLAHGNNPRLLCGYNTTASFFVPR